MSGWLPETPKREPEPPVPRQLPVAHPGATEANAAAKRAESVAAMDRYVAEQSPLCSVFKATGAHHFVADETPTFMCGEQPWIGYILHCTGTRTWVSRMGQSTWPCVAVQVPGERRGSRGRKNVLR